MTKDLLTKELGEVKFKVLIKECCKWFNDWVMYSGEEMWIKYDIICGLIESDPIYKYIFYINYI